MYMQLESNILLGVESLEHKEREREREKEREREREREREKERLFVKLSIVCNFY